MPAGFIEFEASDFPVKIEAFDLWGKIVWESTAESPGGLEIPNLRPTYGPVGIRIFCAGELRSEIPPPDEDYIDELDARTARGEFPGGA